MAEHRENSAYPTPFPKPKDRQRVRVHGISGIKDYREFNRLLDLVRTMPG